MFNKLQNILLCNLAAVLCFVACIGLDSRCIWTMHEPEIPECLKR